MATREARAELVAALLTRADPPDRRRLEARLERARKACGCSTGSAALLVAFGVAVVWWALVRDARVALWPELGVGGVAVVGAAVAGKLAGLAAADVWLWWVGRRLRRG